MKIYGSRGVGRSTYFEKKYICLCSNQVIIGGPGHLRFYAKRPRLLARASLTEKIDFLTVWLCSVQHAQTGQTGHLAPQLDPARPRPDLKKCAETLLDIQYGPQTHI